MFNKAGSMKTLTRSLCPCFLTFLIIAAQSCTQSTATQGVVSFAPLFLTSAVPKVLINDLTISQQGVAEDYYFWFTPALKSFAPTSLASGGSFNITIMGTVVTMIASVTPAGDSVFNGTSSDQSIRINVTYHPTSRTFDYVQTVIIVENPTNLNWTSASTSLTVKSAGVPIDSNGYSHAYFDWVAYRYGQETGQSWVTRELFLGKAEFYSSSALTGFCVHSMYSNSYTSQDGVTWTWGDPANQLLGFATLGAPSLSLVDTLVSYEAQSAQFAQGYYSIGCFQNGAFTQQPSVGLSAFPGQTAAQAAATTADPQWILLP